MKIMMKIKDILKDDELIEQTGLNPYCVNEGADENLYEFVEVKNVNLK